MNSIVDSVPFVRRGPEYARLTKFGMTLPPHHKLKGEEHSRTEASLKKQKRGCIRRIIHRKSNTLRPLSTSHLNARYRTNDVITRRGYVFADSLAATKLSPRHPHYRDNDLTVRMK